MGGVGGVENEGGGIKGEGEENPWMAQKEK